MWGLHLPSKRVRENTATLSPKMMIVLFWRKAQPAPPRSNGLLPTTITLREFQTSLVTCVKLLMRAPMPGWQKNSPDTILGMRNPVRKKPKTSYEVHSMASCHLHPTVILPVQPLIEATRDKKLAITVRNTTSQSEALSKTKRPISKKISLRNMQRL